MKRLASIIATLAAPFAVEAQDTITVKKDSLSFIKSKRMNFHGLKLGLGKKENGKI